MIQPELTVAAIIERDSRFLMVEEYVKGRAVLNQPAGHVEAGECLEKAVIREVQEETACTFTPEAITGIYLWEAAGKRPNILRSVFCGACSGQNPEQALDDGIIATHWLSHSELEQARDRLRSPLVLQAIADYLSGQRYAPGLVQHIAEPA